MSNLSKIQKSFVKKQQKIKGLIKLKFKLKVNKRNIKK